MSEAEIEVVMRVHCSHMGMSSLFTIKDDPDAPELGFELHYSEGTGFKAHLSGLFKEDLPQLIKALQLYSESCSRNK